MTPKPETEITDPLENLKKLFYAIVEFILVNVQVIVIVLFLLFLFVLLFFLNFFNFLGF